MQDTSNADMVLELFAFYADGMDARIGIHLLFILWCLTSPSSSTIAVEN